MASDIWLPPWGNSAHRGQPWRPSSLSLDVRLTNNAAVIIKLLTKIRSKIRAAHRDRTLAQGSKLRLDVGRVQRSGKPRHQLRNRVLGRLGWCNQNVPQV